MNNIKANILPFDTCLSLSVDFMSETTRGREDIPRHIKCHFISKSDTNSENSEISYIWKAFLTTD
jgi:hypothetical protein